MEGKNTAPAQGGIQRTANTNSTMIPGTRHLRIVKRLAAGPCSREELDRVAGASNSPHYAMELRRLGWDLPCRRVKHVDRDGVPGWHGEYSLSPADQGRLDIWNAHRLDALQLRGEG
ncbi:MAG: hypothetical protein CME38_09375 [Haliea sp.]|nr:hypothetical protein [Haliea sp.]